DDEVYWLLPHYLSAIEYWSDEDSGHWEETPKVNNSSIGVVIGAVQQMRKYLQGIDCGPVKSDKSPVSPDILEELEIKGLRALQSLPFESYPSRKADAALLFLLYPIDIIAPSTANQIIEQTEATLVGPYGIKRYEGDSYWCQDYDAWTRIDDRPND